MIKVSKIGDLHRTENFLLSASKGFKDITFDEYGQYGVDELKKVTPVKTGKTAASWTYKIIRKKSKVIIEWHNTNLTSDGACIALLLQYGHGTSSGKYVVGKDYINPAIGPVFDQAINKIWAEVNK